MGQEIIEPGDMDYEAILTSVFEVPARPELLERLTERGLIGQSPVLDRTYIELIDIFGGYSDSAAVIVIAWTLAELELSADLSLESDVTNLRDGFGGFIEAFVPDETIAQTAKNQAHKLLDDQNN